MAIQAPVNGTTEDEQTLKPTTDVAVAAAPSTPSAPAVVADQPVAQGDTGTAAVATEKPSGLDKNDRLIQARTDEVRASYMLAREKNPEEYAKAEKISRRTGIPLTSVLNSFNLASQIDAVQNTDFERIAKVFPATAEFMRDPNKAALTHDDLESMTKTESLINGAKQGYYLGDRKYSGFALFSNARLINSINSVQDQLKSGRSPDSFTADEDPNGVAVMTPRQRDELMQSAQKQLLAQSDEVARLTMKSESIPQDPFVNRVMKADEKSGEEGLARFIPIVKEFLSDPARFLVGVGTSSVVQQAPELLAALGVSLAGAPGLAPAILGGGAFGTEYTSSLMDYLKDAGVDTKSPEALANAALDPEMIRLAGQFAFSRAAPIALEALISGQLAGAIKVPMGPLARSPIATKLVNAVVIQPPIQGLAGGFGEFGAQFGAGQKFDAGQIFAEIVGESFTAPLEVLAITAGQARETYKDAKRSEARADAINGLVQAVQASKTMQRDPETMKDFIEGQLEDGAKNIYIEAEMLAQSDLGTMLAQGSPEFSAKLAEAIEAGTEMAIPISTLATLPEIESMAGVLLDHFRVEGEQYTKAEAQDILANHESGIKKEVERVLKAVQNADAYRGQIDEVKQTIQTQLDATGTYDKKANDAQATLISAFFGAQAARLGMTPMELYLKYEYKVRNSGQAGEGYDQAGMLKIDSAEFKNWFSKSQVADSKGKPITVYHSTAKAFSTFDQNKTADGNFWFTSDKAKLENREAGAAGYGVIMPFYLSAQKLAGWAEYDKYSVDELIAQGYDGIRLDDTYVIFDPTKIKSVDNQGTWSTTNPNTFNQGERGAFNPATLTAFLFKGADLSTFLHESGHFFLEMQFDLAAKLQHEADAFGFDSMSDGQKQIITDGQALLKSFGVADFATWFNLSLDEKRSYHESFARSFEAYLYSGKAPSIELDSAFQKFRSWLSQVYRTLLDLAKGNIEKALNVNISPEVRAVMDRMIATTEQIELAESARSMFPLFNSPQEAGMTQEQFAAYHLLGVNATNEAIAELNAKAQRDMQWQRNARGRELKKLQKLSESLRAQTRIEARADVLQQPVYRVYQFLTGKLTDDDKLVAYETPKSDPNSVDSGIDPLLTAIAKLGGIKRDQAESQWGFDKKARSPQAGIKYVLSRSAGLDIDMMAEKLADYGYIQRDEDGFHDLNELEEKFDAALSGQKVYSFNVLPEILNAPQTAGDLVVNLSGLSAGRLETSDLSASGFTKEQIDELSARGMTAKNGLSADTVAGLSGEFDSGDAMVKALLEVKPIDEAIDDVTDRMMLERHGELATPEAIETAADQAVFNEARARMVAAEMKALETAMGPTALFGKDKNGKPIKRPMLPSAAKQFAKSMIARLTIRNLSPNLYTQAQTRAARAAAQAQKAGDTAQAATEKRNELINIYAAKAAIEAQQEIPKILDYFKTVQKAGRIPVEHYNQILSLLSKFDLRRAVTNKELDNRARFTTYVLSQLAEGNIPPNIEALLSDAQKKAYEKELQSRDANGNLIYQDEDDQAKLLAQMIDEAPVRSYKDMTVEEIRGLRDAVKQIEHMGKRTERVLTDRKNRLFAQVIAEMRERIVSVAGQKGRQATDNVTANNLVGKAKLAWRGFFFSHVKAANLLHIMDDGDNGPMWEHLMGTANEAGSTEAVEIGKSTDIIEKLLAPLREAGQRITGKATFFPSIKRSLNKQAVLVMALNMGNSSNEQRLLGGENWTMEQIKPVLDTLSKKDWDFVQGMWDHYESFRDRVGTMEAEINGVEPDWIEARPFTVQTSDGQTLSLRGGYAPVIYDPRASGKAQSNADSKDAKALMQAARVASTVSKSFTKARVTEVKGRPLLLALDPFLGAVQDTIHYLNWQPWIIDANRMINKLDEPMREHYGATVVTQLRNWAADNAAGMRGPRDGAERGAAILSRNVSYVGLAYNFMSALKQVTGITQSMAIVGSKWMAKGAARTMASPRQAFKDMVELSDFMAKRSTTQFRELNELNSIIQDKNQLFDAIQKAGYKPMTWMQSFVDTPTWWGAYEKAIDGGVDDKQAVLLADQAVIDAQGSGMQKDLSSIERQQGMVRLLTGFMSYMNTTMNVNYRLAKTADFKSVGGVASFSMDAMLVNVMPVLLGAAITALVTPSGDSGDDRLKKFAKKYGADQVAFFFGQLIVFRELQNIVEAVAGTPNGAYSGPSGMRGIVDVLKLAKQIGQGQNDIALWKSAISVTSDIFRLPGGQINKTLGGAAALAQGKTRNPAALIFGFDSGK
ncbi:hypothetical protein UFOVP66_45 [uncultured Caudovirales phage]|uniref:Uncharacterized protein n=1 Tax=uncultured Caudovirales phage TaxID=2100421 RepID=A0A6J5KR43_9CAUD|nr:hypothetical protein UFOVP66_45 [uncultured Caudovirales phage]